MENIATPVLIRKVRTPLEYDFTRYYLKHSDHNAYFSFRSVCNVRDASAGHEAVQAKQRVILAVLNC
jgi:hypothetical protein